MPLEAMILASFDDEKSYAIIVAHTASSSSAMALLSVLIATALHEHIPQWTFVFPAILQ